LKRERPARTAAQIRRIIATTEGWGPSDRTTQRLFTRHDLDGRGDGTPVAVFGRFEADHANELWTGDALHGPPDRRAQGVSVGVHR